MQRIQHTNRRLRLYKPRLPGTTTAMTSLQRYGECSNQATTTRVEFYFFLLLFFVARPVQRSVSVLHCLAANAESKISKSNLAATHPNHRMSHRQLLLIYGHNSTHLSIQAP